MSLSKRLASVLLTASAFFVFPASTLEAQTSCPSAYPMFPPAPVAYTHTAAASGDWNVGSTWSTGTVPGNGAVVCIPFGKAVTVKKQEAARLRWIQVNGELRMWIHSNTRLLVDTLFVDVNGFFVIGDAVNTVKAGVLSELVFISWNGSAIDRSWDPTELSRGFVSMGKVRVFGELKTHMRPVAVDVPKGSTSFNVTTTPTNWKAGDQVVLTGSYFRRVSGATSSQDEKRTLAVAPTTATLSLTSGLTYDHVRPRTDLRLHVANLTRNVVWRSESTTNALRGHVMFMHKDVDVRHVAFRDLGRTNKAVPLDDFIVSSVTNSLGEPDYSIAPRSASLVTNRRGRYAVHFHINGTSPAATVAPSKVQGCVVERTPGWGFVNHSSHVDFLDDVAYDFTGAGFVTEMGDELGSFINDIAIRGTGNGEYRNNRVVFANAQRPQPLADFAFGGDGFWFQGPAVRAKNNVASGCDGAGMIWFTTGSPDPTIRFNENGVTHARYSFFPRSDVSTVYSGFVDLASFLPRYWDHSTTNEKLVISDLPILECDGLESYGNLVGFRLRFNNFDNVDWYNEADFDFHDHIVPLVGSDVRYAERMRQKVKNVKLWNNELALRPNYTSRTDWTTVIAANRLDYDATSGYPGAEIAFQIKENVFSGLTIDGYEVAGVLENCNNNSRSNVSISSQSYSNYALFDTWKSGCVTSCPVPTGVTVTTVSSTSRTIAWTANGAYKRALVRYRANGTQQWKYASTTGSSVTLSGLSTGKTYTFQVISGCQDTSTTKETSLSTYTTAATFNT